MSLPYYCTNCYAVMVNGICPDCSQHPTTTSGTTNDVPVETELVVASKPPAPTVVETPTTDDIMLRVDGPMHHQEYVHGAVSQLEYGLNECRRKLLNTERDLTAAQPQLDRLKAAKIDSLCMQLNVADPANLSLAVACVLEEVDRLRAEVANLTKQLALERHGIAGNQ